MPKSRKVLGRLASPVVVSVAHADIPPVPSAYVTQDLGWLTLSYPASAKERVEPLVADANAMRASIASAFEMPNVLEHVEVRVAPTLADMTRLAPHNNPPPAYASGVAYPRLRLILLSMLEPRGAEAVDLPEVLRHELAHIRRLDTFALGLGRLAAGLYWFNPLMWWALHRLRMEGERAADAILSELEAPRGEGAARSDLPFELIVRGSTSRLQG